MLNNVERYLSFRVAYKGPTDFKGSRILISCGRLKYRKTISYDYGAGDSLDQAIAALTKAGATVKAIATSHDRSGDYDTILTDWNSGLEAIEKGIAQPTQSRQLAGLA